jgi:beta-glucosidase
MLLLLAAVMLCAPIGAAFAAPDPVDARVEALLEKMTLEEKVGQMTLFTSDYDVTGPTLRKQYLDDIRKGRVGAIFNALSPDFTRKLQKMAVEETRLHIPLIFGYDVIHGYKTIFPIPLGEACSFDLRVMERSARIAATEAAADGVQWTFAPMVDIARDPRWGRIAEGAGEDPWWGSQVARARVRGFQGPDLAAKDSVLACAKHYAAYGAALAGRDYNTTDVPVRELYNTYLPPFHAAVDAGCATIMTAFNDLDGIPCTANAFLLDDVLRRQWKFPGFVVTDYTSINEMMEHGNVADQADAARQAALAGVDMDMQSAAYMDHLADLVRSGKVPMKAVDDAVRRILRYKFKKGLFDDPYRNCDNARRDAVMMTAAHRAAARDAARRSIVLLENHQVLPLPRSGATLAVVGPLAADRDDMLGTWSSQGEGKQCISVLEGLRESAPEVKILTAPGCDVASADRSGFQAAVDAARQADVVVAVMGENKEMSGEAASRANPDLPGVQRDLLKALHATGKPVVLVLFNGRPLTISWEKEHLAGIVEAWFLGSEAGHAVADVLFGDYNPAGRLVTTFPRSLGQVPLYYNAMHTGRPMDPKNKYTSKYLDESNDPLYPFGYGLSYTTFAWSPLRLSAAELEPGGTLNVQVTITNSGDRDGEEVAQLYIQDVAGKGVTRPVKELKGVQKVMIAKGQSKTLTFPITAKDLAFYRKDLSYGAEAGQFVVWVGPSSASGSKGSFRLTADVPLGPPPPPPTPNEGAGFR